jgi:hypothetical protein
VPRWHFVQSTSTLLQAFFKTARCCGDDLRPRNPQRPCSLFVSSILSVISSFKRSQERRATRGHVGCPCIQPSGQCPLCGGMRGSNGSGRFSLDAMVVLPGDIETLASTASGLGGDLITRVARLIFARHQGFVLNFEEPHSTRHTRNIRSKSAGKTGL